jgi:hypothetical protein
MLLEVQLIRDFNRHRSAVHISAFLSSKNFALLHNVLLNIQQEIRPSKWSDTLKMKSESVGYFLCLTLFSFTHNSLFANVYYLATSFDPKYRKSSGYCIRTGMHVATKYPEVGDWVVCNWTHHNTCTLWMMHQREYFVKWLLFRYV